MTTLTLRESAFIAGRWESAQSGKQILVTDPGTGKQLGTVPDCGAVETKTAIHAAVEAQQEWANWTANRRGRILRRLVDAMSENESDLARICTLENGKPLSESTGEIRYGASFIEWFAEEGKRIYGETIPASSNTQRILVTKEPIGVCAAITPWNFPSAMLARTGRCSSGRLCLGGKAFRRNPFPHWHWQNSHRQRASPMAIRITGQPNPFKHFVPLKVFANYRSRVRPPWVGSSQRSAHPASSD